MARQVIALAVLLLTAFVVVVSSQSSPTSSPSSSPAAAPSKVTASSPTASTSSPTTAPVTFPPIGAPTTSTAASPVEDPSSPPYPEADVPAAALAPGAFSPGPAAADEPASGAVTLKVSAAVVAASVAGFFYF